MPLSDVAVHAAKPQSKLVKLSDGDGLQLLVTPSGGKLWRLAYRCDGKQKQLALGASPATGLADAQKARGEARATLAAGIDPSEKAKVDKGARTAPTVTHRAAMTGAKGLGALLRAIEGFDGHSLTRPSPRRARAISTSSGKKGISARGAILHLFTGITGKRTIAEAGGDAMTGRGPQAPLTRTGRNRARAREWCR